jgi:predicted dithiol-disulfide oxidoreductase (DUF899 family)
VAALRRSLPPGPVVRAYELREGPADLAADVMGPGTSVDLPDLLGTHDTLVVYHLMFWPDGGCPMCSMWLDGLDGVAAHLDQHVALAVTAPVPLRQLRDWGVARGGGGCGSSPASARGSPRTSARATAAATRCRR